MIDMRAMDYRLQVFARVAEQQNISAAARELNISQPAVTHHVKMLEEAFQATLLTRSRSGVTLTEAGQILLAHARQVALLEDEAAVKIRRGESALSGRLRLGASTTVTQYYLADILTRFKKRHHGVIIEVIEGNSETVIARLLEQRIDLGLIEAPCRRRDLRVQQFFEDELVFIVPVDHPLAKKRQVAPEELLKHPMVSREHGSGTRQCVERSLAQSGVDIRRMKIVQDLPSTEAIKRAVAAGLGIGCVSRIALTQELATKSLAVVKVRGLEIRRPFSTILPLGPDPLGLRQIFLAALAR